MAPESIADEARSDEAVRRIREESRRRIERQNGWRAFSSLCALASLAGGISLAALNAREARLEQQAATIAERLRLEEQEAVARRAAEQEAARARDRELAAKAWVEARRAEIRAAALEAASRDPMNRRWRKGRARIIACDFRSPFEDPAFAEILSSFK